MNNNTILLVKKRFNDVLFIIFSIFCFLMIICPFFTVMKDGSSTLNYIYNNGHTADGVLVIPLILITFLLSLFKFNKWSLIPLSLVVLILIFLFVNISSKDYLSYATFNFYLMYISLIGIIITDLIMIFKKDK